MRRTQVQLGEATYRAIRRRAFESGRSISSVVREFVDRGLAEGARKKPRALGDFGFVGSGASRQGRLSPVSERHDEALVQDTSRKAP